MFWVSKSCYALLIDPCRNDCQIFYASLKSKDEEMKKENLPFLDKKSDPDVVSFVGIGRFLFKCQSYFRYDSQVCCTGVCYWTGRIKRLGQTPILLRGMESLVMREVTSTKEVPQSDKSVEVSNDIDRNDHQKRPLSIYSKFLVHAIVTVLRPSEILLSKCSNTVADYNNLPSNLQRLDISSVNLGFVVKIISI